MARSGDFSQEVMIDPMRRSKQDQLWQVMTKVDNAKLTLSRDHYNLAAKNYHAEYACFTPFLRNRMITVMAGCRPRDEVVYSFGERERYASRGGTGVAVTFQAARARPLGQRHSILYVKSLYGKYKPFFILFQPLYLYLGVPQRDSHRKL